jgi:nucleoside-diphosphate-sugar epimerase
MKYAILGAAGAVGKAVAKELAGAGNTFRVVGRQEAVLRREFSGYGPLVEIFPADLSDPTSTLLALEGIHTVFFTVGVPYNHFDLHPKLSRVAVGAAVQTGVQRFLHVSNVYPYGYPQTNPVTETHPREPETFKGKMRKEQEDIVLAAHGQKGLRSLVVCPADYYGVMELSILTSLFKAALNGGSAQLLGPIDKPHEFIYVPDLARVLAALAEKEEAYGQRWNAAGPGTITPREFALEVFRQTGRKPKLQVAGKTLLKIIGIFNPIVRELGEMHYLIETPVLLDDSKLRALLPDLQKTSYPEGIRLTLEAMRLSKPVHQANRD